MSLFIVSMHGATALTQDRISKALGSFEQAVQGTRDVKEFGAKVRTNWGLQGQLHRAAGDRGSLP